MTNRRIIINVKIIISLLSYVFSCTFLCDSVRSLNYSFSYDSSAGTNSRTISSESYLWERVHFRSNCDIFIREFSRVYVRIFITLCVRTDIRFFFYSGVKTYKASNGDEVCGEKSRHKVQRLINLIYNLMRPPPAAFSCSLLRFVTLALVRRLFPNAPSIIIILTFLQNL